MCWTGHAGQRLIQRQISPEEVIDTLLYGSIVEQYPTDYPYPSCLLCSRRDGRPLHVVCSVGNAQLFIITAYRPDIASWDETFTHRKSR